MHLTESLHYCLLGLSSFRVATANSNMGSPKRCVSGSGHSIIFRICHTIIVRTAEINIHGSLNIVVVWDWTDIFLFWDRWTISIIWIARKGVCIARGRTNLTGRDVYVFRSGVQQHYTSSYGTAAET